MEMSMMKKMREMKKMMDEMQKKMEEMMVMMPNESDDMNKMPVKGH